MRKSQLLLCSLLALCAISCKTKPADSDTTVDSTSAMELAPAASCERFLEPIYNTFKVHSTQDVIIQLHDIYSLEESKYNQKRSSTSFSSILPDWGKQDFNNNKKAIDQLFKKITDDKEYQFSSSETYDFFSQTVDPRVAELQYKNYLLCKNPTSPTLELISNDSSKVVVNLTVRPNNYTSQFQLNSAYSANLKLDDETNGSDTHPKAVLTPGGYTLSFTRKNLEKGVIAVNLEKQDPLLISFEAINNKPKYQYGWFSSDAEGRSYMLSAKVNINWGQNNYSITTPDGKTQIYPWQRTRSLETMINTALDIDSVQIAPGDIHFSYPETVKSVTASSVGNMQTRKVDIRTFLRFHRAETWVSYTIYYKKLRSYCVNCD